MKGPQASRLLDGADIDNIRIRLVDNRIVGHPCCPDTARAYDGNQEQKLPQVVLQFTFPLKL
jgi:hypothetical protein